jgi:site-specific DNA-methyltransferase (adenine-specific)
MIKLENINNITDCINQFILGDNEKFLNTIEDNSIDLVVTSPPYDDLREYNNVETWNFEKFKKIASELYKKVKDGGVVVWIVNDSTSNGDESGNSFRQALYFKEVGFKLHDTMIYNKNNFSNPSKNRYHQLFEYMFIFVKGKLKTFNPIKDKKNRYFGSETWGKQSARQKDGSLIVGTKKTVVNEFGMRGNVWNIICSNIVSQKNKKAFQHPAVFPEILAHDHILSWSNKGDTVCDIFGGSGTVVRMCKKLDRNFIYVDCSEEYVKLAEEIS